MKYGFARKLLSLPRRVAILQIRIYQMTLSHFLGRHCRFSPTCSEYAIQAIDRYGLLRGGFMAFKRILHCHPFSAGGYDPVP